VPSDTLSDLKAAAKIGVRTENDLFAALPDAVAATKVDHASIGSPQAHARRARSHDFCGACERAGTAWIHRVSAAEMRIAPGASPRPRAHPHQALRAASAAMGNS